MHQPHGSPRGYVAYVGIVTDKLKSYGAAERELLLGVEPRQHRYLNNRGEFAPAHASARMENRFHIWQEITPPDLAA